ncbi:MAG: ribosome small subunit-dependent GTPase A [Christensenellaceae bacterium]|nr:ribosome small subunit-dependent GTPase A [Christensenellaceae bacterium]
MSKKGIILKGIGGFYYVKADDGITYETKARGRFRKEGIKPLAGDVVDIADGWIENIYERKNVLIRPPVANAELLLIVISASLPVPDMVMVDKLILYGKKSGLEVILAINKIDEGRTAAEEIAEQYKNAEIKTVLMSNHTGEGIEELKSLIRGKCTCLAGQSAVGKSSFVNTLSPSLQLETGDIIKKTEKGKQTTRQSELIYLDEIEGSIVDTPGFAVLEALDIEPEELQNLYPDFKNVGNCRFKGCIHDKEADCAVKMAVKDGRINKRRYARYLVIFEELKQRRLEKYD